MKECNTCHLVLDEEQFDWKNKTEGKRHGKCKSCMSEYRKEYYQKQGVREAHGKKVGARKKQIRKEYQEWKVDQSCKLCGEDSPECLDLHHLDPSIKDASLSELIRRGSSWKKLLEEIDKCAILCSNCHRKVHSGRIVL